MLKQLVAGTLLFSSAANAEPIGRWFSGFGQGTTEYGIKNDSAGSDYFYIACPSERGADISITVGGRKPQPGSTAVVTIGANEYRLATDRSGTFKTNARVAHDSFGALWTGMRRGVAMRVRLSTGQSTVFTLRGAGKVLGRTPCDTDFTGR